MGLGDLFCISVPNYIKIAETVAEIERFSKRSQMAAVRHLGFSKKNNDVSAVGCQICVTVPNFIKISQTVGEVL